MPQLDFVSMAVLIAINLAVVGGALPLVMGTPVSRAAQHAQRYFLLQAGAWICILTASSLRGHPLDIVLSVTATCLVALAQWQIYLALQHWLGPRPLRRVLHALCWLGPVGFLLLFAYPPLRLAWFSTIHALCLVCLAYCCLHPQRPAASSWRTMMACCGVVMATSLLVRAGMGLWSPWLRDFTQDTTLNYLFAAVSHVCGSLLLVSMLVAWRDETNQKLRDMAMTDQLTGLPNRRALMHAAPLMQAMAKRQKLSIALVVLDLDHFKNVNDRYGHPMGDRALQLFADVLREQMRMDEIAARWGGEEFCVLMYADGAAVDVFYRRIRKTLSQRSEAELGFRLGLSAGYAVQQAHSSLQQLLHQADAALYQSKSAGRGRITAYHSGLSSQAPAPVSAASAHA